MLVALTANLVIAVAKAVVAGRAPRRTSPDPLGVTGLIVLGVTLAVIGMVLHANEARESPAATGERGGA